MVSERSEHLAFWEARALEEMGLGCYNCPRG